MFSIVNIMDHNANPRQDHNQFTIVRKLDDIPLPIGFKELLNNRNKKVEVVQSESALLNYLMGKCFLSLFLFLFIFY